MPKSSDATALAKIAETLDRASTAGLLLELLKQHSSPEMYDAMRILRNTTDQLRHTGGIEAYYVALVRDEDDAKETGLALSRNRRRVGHPPSSEGADNGCAVHLCRPLYAIVATCWDGNGPRRDGTASASPPATSRPSPTPTSVSPVTASTWHSSSSTAAPPRPSH